MATKIRDLIPDDAIERIAGPFDDLRDRVARSMPRERAKRARRDRGLALLGGLALGAALAYFLGPRMGRGRRTGMESEVL